MRKWTDRRKRLELPLFPGYVFVRLPLQERLRVLEIPSVARLVGFNNLPTALRDDEMEAMRNGLTRPLRAAPHPYLKVWTSRAHRPRATGKVHRHLAADQGCLSRCIVGSFDHALGRCRS